MDEKEKLKKLKELTETMNQTFDFGCTDEAWDKYAHAVYYIVSENKIFEDCLQEFIDYVEENKEYIVK